MAGSELASSKTSPYPHIPESGQFSDHSSHSVVNKQAWDVLNEHVSGSKLPNETGVFKPKTAASRLNASLFSCVAEVLTGKAAADEIDGFEVCASDGADFVIVLYVRPVFAEDLPAERIDLDVPPAFVSGPRQTQIDSADAGKQASKCHKALWHSHRHPMPQYLHTILHWR